MIQATEQLENVEKQYKIQQATHVRTIAEAKKKNNKSNDFETPNAIIKRTAQEMEEQEVKKQQEMKRQKRKN